MHQGSDLGGHRCLAASVRFDEPVQRALNKVVELRGVKFEAIFVIFGNVQFGKGFGCRQFFEAIPIIGMRTGNALAGKTS